MAEHKPKRTRSEAVRRLGSNNRPTRGGSRFASLASSPFRLLREGSPTAIAILLFALVVWTFLPSLHHGFVNLDDDVYVYESTHVPQGLTWENICWAATTLDAGFWHPLTWLSLLLDGQLFGLRPGGYHLTGLLLHGANTILLFVLFRRMTGATWRSAFVAALFAVHPLHVEPVAWVATRKDVLSTLFWMLAMLMYVRYAEEVKVRDQSSEVRGQKPLPSAIFYLLSLLFFVCGLMSKTMVVTLPFILLLVDWWPLRRLQLKTPDLRPKTLCFLFLEKLPFLAASFVCGLLTVRAERGVGALQSGAALSLLERVANATLSYVRYLGQTFWPRDLAVYYPYPASFALWAVVGAGLVLLTV